MILEGSESGSGGAYCQTQIPFQSTLWEVPGIKLRGP